MHSPPVQPSSSSSVGHRLGQDDVRRGDREARAQRAHAARGRAHREHRGVGSDRSARRSRTRTPSPSRRGGSERDAGVLVHERAALDQPRPQPERRAGRGGAWRSRAPSRRRGTRASRSARAPPPGRARPRARAPRAPRRPRRPPRPRRRSRGPWTRTCTPTGRTRRPRRWRGTSRRSRPPCRSRRPAARARRRRRSGRAAPAALSHSDSQNPPLRPLGPWPQTSPSSSATRAPGSASSRCHAVHRPVKPPPITTTSAFTSPFRAGLGVGSPASSSHQPPAVCRSIRIPDVYLDERLRWPRHSS